MERLQVDACGPDHKDFLKSLRRANGRLIALAGVVLLHTHHLATVAHAWIPKQNVEDLVIPPKKMRPIAVMSIWWRAFSST